MVSCCISGWFFLAHLLHLSLERKPFVLPFIKDRGELTISLLRRKWINQPSAPGIKGLWLWVRKTAVRGDGAVRLLDEIWGSERKWRIFCSLLFLAYKSCKNSLRSCRTSYSIVRAKDAMCRWCTWNILENKLPFLKKQRKMFSVSLKAVKISFSFILIERCAVF